MDAPSASALTSPASSLASSAPSDASALPVDEASYDLDADVRRRLADAARELGPRTLTHVEAGRFVLAAGREGTPFDAAVKLVHATLEALANGRIAGLPAQAVTVFVLPSRAAFDVFCRGRFDGGGCPSKYGVYLKEPREIFADASNGARTLAHEVTHPLLEADFPEAPLWLQEGIASLYEAPELSHDDAGAEIHGVKNWRLPRLLAAFASPEERRDARLDALFGMTDEAFRAGDEELHYAMARYACQWLDHDGRLWPFYHAWRDGAAGDPTGERAFVKVVGKAPRETNDDWVAWVRRL